MGHPTDYSKVDFDVIRDALLKVDWSEDMRDMGSSSSSSF